MKGIFYNTDNKSIRLLRFYPDLEVISTTLGYTSELSDESINVFDRDHLIAKLHPNIYSKTSYQIDNGIINFIFNHNGNIVSYKAKLLSNDELIIEIENHNTGYRTKIRYSIIDKFPERNDNVKYSQEFYPIILLPNNIIQNIKSDVSKQKVYEYLNISLPKLEKLKLPIEPKGYEYVKKEKSKFQGDGCISIAQIPMAAFFAIMFFYCLGNEKPLLGLVFIVGAIIMGKDIFNFKTVEITEKEDIPSEVYFELKEKYRNEKKIVEEKNKALENEFNDKMRKIDSDIASRIDFVKHQVFLSNLKPISKAVRSNEEGKRGKTELHFLNRLYDKFGSQIKVDMAPTKDYQFYFPDFTFICEKTGLHIDIEIDEPYSYSEKKPIHHTETNDDERNRYFLEQNWCIVRFSEKQIIKEMDNCVSLIEEIVNSIHSKSLDFSTNIVNPDKRWTYEEALVMIHNNTRNSY